mgnify:CR=1 FL=1
MKRALVLVILIALSSLIVLLTVAQQEGRQPLFVFAHITDSHIARTTNYESVLNYLGSRSDVQLVVWTGDITDHGYESEYQTTVDAISSAGLSGKVIPAAGNHDWWGIGDTTRENLFKTYFNVPALNYTKLWNFTGSDGNTYTILFVVMTPECDYATYGTNYRVRESEIWWLDEVLTQYSNIPAIVLIHYPPNVINATNPTLFNEFLSVLEKHNNVKLVLSGHGHTNDIWIFNHADGSQFAWIEGNDVVDDAGILLYYVYDTYIEVYYVTPTSNETLLYSLAIPMKPPTPQIDFIRVR